MELPHRNELVCLAIQEASIAVGSQSHITVLDSRSQSPVVDDIPSLDGNWGVRALDYRDHIITCGGGQGRLSFYDTRNRNYMPSPVATSRSASEGWLDPEAFVQLPQAIYSLGYHPTTNKLFTAGGPILNSVKGFYAAVWY